MKPMRASLTKRVISVACLCGFLAVGPAPAFARLPQKDRQRVGAPEWLACPRDQLTAYIGTVLSLRTEKGRTIIRIKTDWQTTESVTIHHPKTSSAAPWFRLNGEAFQPGDWRSIESTKGRLKPGTRANVWVCEDGGNPVVDWQVRK